MKECNGTTCPSFKACQEYFEEHHVSLCFIPCNNLIERTKEIGPTEYELTNLDEIIF